MAEYLDPRDGYTLVTLPDWKAPEPWLIDVPDGAVMYFNWGQTGIDCEFHDKDGNIVGERAREIPWTIDGLSRWGSDVIWQRPTQPEELPFIDDEPRPKPRERVYAVLGDNVPEQQQFVINGIDYTKAIQLGAKALQLAIRTFSEAMKQK